MSNKLVNPRLDLFIYHYKGGLGDYEKDIEANSQLFWNNFPDGYPASLKIPYQIEKNSVSNKYLKLLKLNKTNDDEIYQFERKIKDSDLNIRGFYQPVSLGDIYGLGFAYEIENQEIESQPISVTIEDFYSYLKDEKSEKFIPNKLLQHNTLEDFKNNYIGTTQIISGCLPDSEKIENINGIVEVICKKFNFKKELLKGKPNTNGIASIFELSYCKPIWDYLDNNYHVLILLCSDLTTLNKIQSNLYDDWLRLFSYRNKIIWAYWQARDIVPWLKSNFFAPEKVRQNPAIKRLIIEQKPEIKTANQAMTLKQLQEALHDNSFTLWEYVRKLNLLKIHLQTIQTNTKNYKVQLKEIQNKAEELGSIDFYLLDDFCNNTSQGFKTEIVKEYNSLASGVSVLQNLTDTLRGYVQIQQADIERNIEEQNQKLQNKLDKQNRKLQDFSNKLAVVGIGIGAASAAASASSAYMGTITENIAVNVFQTKLNPSSQATCSTFITLLFSLCIGRLASTLTYCWVRHRKYHRIRRERFYQHAFNNKKDCSH